RAGVVRDCRLITINGQPLSFPPELEATAKSLAAAAAEAGKRAVDDLMKDPNQPIADYFGKVYRTAYLDGFWRALVFVRHNQREGRLKRLRELWKAFAENGKEETVYGSPLTVIQVETSVYDEFKQLLELGDSTDVTRSSDQHPAIQAGQTPVS